MPVAALLPANLRSGLLRFDVARGKAWGALGMGMSSRLIRDWLESRPSFQAALGVAADGKIHSGAWRRAGQAAGW